MALVNVIMVERKAGDKHLHYVTICMRGHWDCEGVMITSGTWDATKFDLEDPDAFTFCEYINSTREETFVVASIDTCHLSEARNEYWSDKHVHCNFKTDRMFKGVELR